MLAEPSDMHIVARWIVPMAGEREILERHTLVLRDGRILAVLPNDAAAELYAPRVCLTRSAHLLMPGLVNAHTRIGTPLRASAAAHYSSDAALLGIANMLRAGVTAFCDVGYFPSDAARSAQAQGMRALIGLPVTERPSPWAHDAREYLTRALRLRDEYKGHPLVSTAFAPLRPVDLDDATLARLGTLAAELDAGMLLALHASQRELEESMARHGMRPLARLERLGLLTPSLTASHAVHLDGAEIELARRAGIGVVLCLASSLRRAEGLPPLAALAHASRAAHARLYEAAAGTAVGRAAVGDAAVGGAAVGDGAAVSAKAAADPDAWIRLSLGSDGEFCGAAEDVWTGIKLLALHGAGSAARAASGARAAVSPWEALAAATRGGAAVLGLEAETGTLEPGKWADVCCVDFGAPALQPPTDPLRQLVFGGGRDMVSDVWVAGRQLLCEGRFTRLDWPDLAARLSAEAAPAAMGDS
jgi:5-methylthioadenosine/S-adenosylhomocysteine deaminase